MKFRIGLLILAVTLLSILAISTAQAGGWAVITLDEMPGEIQAGEPLEIGFTVLQHGRTPMEGLTPTIRASNSTTGETFFANASPEGETGHYAASLNFPSGGSWDWSIEAFTMNQSMPALKVLSGPAENRASSVPVLWWLVAGAGLGSIAGGLVFFRRKSLLWAAALVLIGMAVAGYGFVSAAASGAVAEADSVAPVQIQATAGQDLFVAKGCVTCHAHAGIERDWEGAVFVDVGPDLTNFTADPDYLRRWLSDPSAIKPNTIMPDLRLSEDEIEQLIAFINTD
jgi:cytochrome c2